MKEGSVARATPLTEANNTMSGESNFSIGGRR